MTTVLKFSAEGLDEIRTQLEALGDKGARALKALNDAGAASATAGLKALGNASEVTTGQTMALTAAARHMFDSIASGTPPIEALTREFGNLSYALSGGGLSGAIKQAGSLLGGLINPLTVSVAAVAAVAAAAVAAYKMDTDAQNAFAASLRGVGAASGATVGDLERISEAAAHGSGITVGAAREIANSLVQTGKVGVASLGDLIGFTERYAKVTGEDATAATKEVVAAMERGKQGVIGLAEKFGLLSAAEVEHIQNLISAGKAHEAFRELTEKGLPTMETSIGAWQRLKNAVSDFFTSLGQGINHSTPVDEVLASYKAQLAGLEAAAKAGQVVSMDTINALRTQIAALEKQAAEADAKAQQQADQIRRNQAGIAGVTLAESLQPGAAQLKQIQTLRAALDSGTLSQKQATETANALAVAMKAYNEALASAAKTKETVKVAYDDVIAAQKRAIQYAHMEADAAERVRAGDEAVAAFKKAHPDATPEMLNNIRTGAEAAVRAQQAQAAAIKATKTTQEQSTKALEEAQTAYQQLLTAGAPVEAQTIRVAKWFDALDLLLKNGKLTAEQYAAGQDAIAQALVNSGQAFVKQVDAIDKRTAEQTVSNEKTLAEIDGTIQAKQAIVDKTTAIQLDTLATEENNAMIGKSVAEQALLRESYDQLRAAILAGADLQKKALAAEPIKKAAEEARRQADETTNHIVQQSAEMMAKISNNWKGTWKSLGDFVKNLMRQVFSDIAANAIVRPIVSPIINAFYGVSGGAGAGAPVSLGGLGAPGTSGGLGSLGGISQAFSIGRMLTGINSGFNSLTALANRGVNAIFGTNFGALPGGAAGPLPSSQAGFLGLGTTLGGSLLSGGGAFLLSLLSGQGLGKSALSGAFTGGGFALGNVLLPGIGGPIGAVLGSVIGSLFGSLFKKKPNKERVAFETSATNDKALFEGGYSILGPFGYVGLNDAKTKGTPSSLDHSLAQIVAKLDSGIAQALQPDQIAKVAAALQANGGVGWRVTEQMKFDNGAFDLVKDRLTNIMKALDIPAQAISDALGSVERSKDNIDQLVSTAQQYIQTRQGYLDTINAVIHPTNQTQAAQALKSIDDTYKNLVQNAQAYALSLVDIDKYHTTAVEQYRAGAVSGISDQLLQLTNPQAYAKAQAEAANDNLLKEATAAGVLNRIVDGGLTVAQAIAKLRELNVAAALKQFTSALDQAKQSVKDWLNAQSLGGSSILAPIQQLAEAQRQYQDLLTKARAGDADATSNVTKSADALIQIAQQVYGSSTAEADIVRRIRAELGAIAGVPGFATGGSFTVGGRGGTDTNLIAFRATRGEMVNVTRPGQASANDNHAALLREVSGKLDSLIRLGAASGDRRDQLLGRVVDAAEGTVRETKLARLAS